MITELSNTATEDRNESTLVTQKSTTWENNHARILRAIVRLIRIDEQWPTHEEVAEETGFDRSTVYRHLLDFNKDDFMEGQLEALRLVTSSIVAKMVDKAVAGDVRAMRLAFELTGLLKKGKGGAVVENRNTNGNSAV